MTDERIKEIARANADAALDQVDAYDSVEAARDSYEGNVRDTVIETGGTDYDADEAVKVYRSILGY